MRAARATQIVDMPSFLAVLKFASVSSTMMQASARTRLRRNNFKKP